MGSLKSDGAALLLTSVARMPPRQPHTPQKRLLQILCSLKHHKYHATVLHVPSTLEQRRCVHAHSAVHVYTHDR
jgi:hypothetical protein